LKKVIVSLLDTLLWRRGLRLRIAERDTQLEARGEAIREREEANREREARIVELKAEIREREEANREREARIVELEAECGSLAGQLHSLQSLLAHREAQIEDLKNRVGSTVEAIRELSFSNEATRLATEPSGAELRRGLIAPMRSSATQFSEHAIAPVLLSEERVAEVLGQWRAYVADQGHVQSGAQVFIDPYIVQRRMAGIPTNILIGTREGQLWYDRFDLTDLPWVQMLGMIGPGDVIIDCGSNQGVNALHYSGTVGTNGHVHGFDPFPINTHIAQINASLNARSNLSFYQKAVGRQPGRLRVSVAAQNIVEYSNAGDNIDVEVITLDTLAPLRPNFLKIDIEGAEVDALEGAQELLKLRPFVFLELHPPEIVGLGRKPSELFEYLDLARYTCLINYPDLPTLFRYEGQFKLAMPCAMFFLPKDRPAMRHFF
jgi:FkbM family methyltransferase